MNAQEVLYRLHLKEAVALLGLLDRDREDLIRTAAIYNCGAREFSQWVYERVRRQLEKAKTANQSGPFTPVVVASDCAESLQVAWPTGSVSGMVESQSLLQGDTHKQVLLQHPTYGGPLEKQIDLVPNSVQDVTSDVNDDPYGLEWDAHQRRLDMCGTKRWRENGNGGSYLATMWCHDFRNCSACGSLRANRILKELGEVSKKFDLTRAVVADNGVAKSLRRAHKKPTYRCFPQANGETVFFFSEFQADKYPALEVEIVTDLADDDWPVLTKTPEGRRISGALGVEPKKIKSGANVTLTDFQMDAPEGKDQFELMAEASYAVEIAAPRPLKLTPENWQAWMLAVAAARKQACTDLGAKVTEGFEYKLWYQDVDRRLVYTPDSGLVEIKRPDDGIPVPF